MTAIAPVPPSDDLGARRFLFITGKGGVGKTTVAAALATALARRGKRVLLTLSEAKERVSTLFGVPPIGTEIVPVAAGICAVRITPEVAMREYGLLVLKSRALYSAVFENKYVKSVFQGVPGLNEWAVLGKAWYHATEREADGSPRFDVVLFDAPATGHGIELLRVPKSITELVPPGLLRRDAELAWRMFQDPRQSGVIVVTLPEEMPTNESIELIAALRGELGLPVARIVVNGTLQGLFTPSERAALLRWGPSGPLSNGQAALAAAARRALREGIQAENLSRLVALGLPLQELPLLYRTAAAPDAVAELSREF